MAITYFSDRNTRMTQADTLAPLGQALLGQITRSIAARPQDWIDLVRFDPNQRWYHRLADGGEHEVWLLSWLPGQQTGFHDHGRSAGAFTVALGALCERAAPGRRPQPAGTRLGPGASRSFGPRYVHDVMNTSARPAVSVHAYSPPLAGMSRYELTDSGLLRSCSPERWW
jgi:predicted metal-dependent enzyme (double-stranded beta helix superfamily)